MSLFNFGSKLPAGVTKAKIEDKSAINVVDLEGFQLMCNDGVNICAHACSACWDVKLPADYEGRAKYVSNRTATGHSSVTEHSNNVFYFTIDKSEVNHLVEILDANRYLSTCVRFSKKHDYIYMIIGGSWRAWNYLVYKMSTFLERTGCRTNPIFERIKSSIYNNCNYSGFTDLIKANILTDKFLNVNMVDCFANTVKDEPIAVSKKVDCYGLDNINMMAKLITGCCPEPELFTIADLFDFCTCSILFKDMSRNGTLQLVRHRNGITQESQRYVDYSRAAFSSPAEYKDCYDPDYKYPVTFGRSSQKMTLQEIGDNIAKIYGQLSDKDKLGKLALLKEDARGFLPSNIKCRKIYITFTWRYLFKFLTLREDKHAQAEIRSYATDIGNWFAEQYPEFVPLYRKDAGDPDWVNMPIPNNNLAADDMMNKESFIEAIENSIKMETIDTEKPE